MNISARHTRYFDDVSVGDPLDQISRGPMTPVHLMRWSAAIENWHRIHYDLPFATEHDGLPGLLVNGSWKQHLLVQVVREWLGNGGWLAKIEFQFRGMDLAGSTLIASGVVTGASEHDDLGFVECDVSICNDDGDISTSGQAVGVLPLRGGSPVPYPFVIPEGYR